MTRHPIETANRSSTKCKFRLELQVTSQFQTRQERQVSNTLTNITLKIWRQDGPDAPGPLREPPDPRDQRRGVVPRDARHLQRAPDRRGQEAIVFDHDCREGICGTCSLMIDGQAHGPQQGAATCQLHMRTFNSGDEIVIEPWRATGVPDHQGPDGRPRPARPHRRGRWIHHRPDRWRTRRQPDPDPEAGRRCLDGRRRMHRLRCLCGGVPERRGHLFTSAKLAHLNLLPQGQAERYKRAEAMVETMEEHFGSCTNHGECRRRARRRSRSTRSPS